MDRRRFQGNERQPFAERDKPFDDGNRPWNQADYDRYEARQGYQALGSESSSSFLDRDRDRSFADQHQNWNPDRRNSSRNSEWDDRRPGSQNEGDASSGYPTSSYGSNNVSGSFADQRWNANQSSYGKAYQGSYGRNDQGNFGSYGQSPDSGRNGYLGSQTESRFYGQDVFSESKSGRSPKGYKRSDERIREEVCEILTHHPDVDPSEVDIQVSGSEITLTGTVDNRQEKRLIEDLASSVSGVTEVNNQLRVSASKT
jgi:osmotically-inducible protein OsmY